MHKISVVLLIVVAAGAGFAAGWFGQPQQAGQDAAASAADPDKPLYWVAPMDPNYRRDKPGKSPMGMDLIPVYAEDAQTAAPGEVTIAPEVENNLSVRSELVQYGQLQGEVQTAGYITFDEARLSHVHPRVEGWIEQLSVKTVGEPVKKGQKLFEIYSPTLVAAQEEYAAALKSGHASLIRASKGRLLALGVNASLIKRLDKGRSVQQRIAVYAERSGFIKQLNVRQGMYVQPGTEVLSIGEIDQVWVIAEVFEKDATYVAEGQMVTMQVDAFPQQQWQGTIDYIYPVLNAKNRTLQLRARFDNPEQKLRPNMFAKLTLDYQEAQSHILLPQQALIRTGKMNRVVLALGHGRYQSVPVKIGKQSSTQVEVLAGLQQSDRVVTSAQFLIDSESSITADFERMAAALEAPDRVWVTGTLHHIDAQQRQLDISHAAIPEWHWPAMRMKLNMAEQLGLADIQANTSIGFCLDKLESGRYEITHIEVNGPVENTAEADHSGMDHSGMDHSGMDNSGMDHSGMDHSGMDHSGMDHSGMDHSGMDHSGMDHSGMKH